MAGTTQLTPADVTAMANKHTALADDITAQQKTLAGHVQTLVTVNQGAMMTKLTSVHADWDNSTAQIVNNLRDMANTLNSVAQNLQAQDQETDVTV